MHKFHKQKLYTFIDSYFVFNDTECIKSLDKYINHYYDKVIKYCTLYKADYYCINNNKRICSYIFPDEIDTYYKIGSGPNPCLEKCYKKFKYYNKCLDTGDKYTKCVDIAVLFDNDTCYINPLLIYRGSCLIKLHEISDDNH